MRADDGVRVEGIHLVMTGPRVEQPEPIESRDPVRKGWPREGLEGAAIGRKVERVGIGHAISGRESAQV
jgi:hypothetical protein